MATKEQERSAFALKELSTFFGEKIDEKDANFLVGLPTMILQNGFGQTLAFLYSKAKGNDKDKHYKAAQVILKWADMNNAHLGIDPKKALTSISTMEAPAYMQLQQETLLMLNWLKRYARAFQKQEGEKK